MFRKWVLPWVVWLFYASLVLSWRKRVTWAPGAKAAMSSGKTVIIAHWHGDELSVLHLVKPLKIATMTSTSSDGELIDFVIRRLGGATSRGSSTRGGTSALRGLLRLLRLGYRSSMAVDGPKGPLHQVKPGVFEIAKLTKGVVIPLGAASSFSHCFERSWNKARLPLFFSRVEMYFGDPIDLSARDDLDPRDPILADDLRRRINNASSYAANLIAEAKSPMLASR